MTEKSRAPLNQIPHTSPQAISAEALTGQAKPGIRAPGATIKAHETLMDVGGGGGGPNPKTETLNPCGGTIVRERKSVAPYTGLWSTIL